MSNLLRTTITMPKDLLKMAKMRAVDEDISLSQLVREAVREKLLKRKEVSKKKLKLGKYSLRIKSDLSRREIYGRFLKRRISS